MRFTCLLVGMFAWLSSTAQAQQPIWSVLGSGTVEAANRETTVDLPTNTERTTAVQIRFAEKVPNIIKASVTYTNGQIHYETRDTSISVASQFGEFDVRGEPRIIAAVTMTAADVSSPVKFEILGKRGEGRERTVVGSRGQAKWTAVPLFYGTTRNSEAPRMKDERKIASYGVNFGGDLTIGRAVVTVPLEREPGTIPRPSWVRLVLGKEDPSVDFVVAGVERLETDAFQKELGKQAAGAKRFAGQAFVFVHGFNVSFDDGLFRAAQISHDIGFDGATVLYSWPSKGSVFGYRYDADTAKLGRTGLLKLIETVSRVSDVKKINVIAHSLGNDVLVEVLSQLSAQGPRTSAGSELKLNEMVFASPDVAQPVFVEFAQQFSKLGAARTLYASNSDKALQLSRAIRTGVPRAGDVPQSGPIVVKGIETIDVSEADLGLFSLNHSTFAERRHIVEDLRLLFSKSKHPPSERFPVYKQLSDADRTWWAYMRN